MNKSDIKIHIIGAGVSGLIAAQTLEKHGYTPVLLEATDSVGGRVKTDIVDGYQLDHGFQVLLTAYPAAKKFLDYEKLDLQNFLPGAAIFNKGKATTIGDPLRNISLLFPTIFAANIPLRDKLKIFKLNLKLKNKNLDEIFQYKEVSTLNYLQNAGFSQTAVDQFFRPFFSGIFLETALETSSRMFEFIYKMFGEGNAALPKSGIQAIPQQIFKNLKSTKILFNTNVLAVNKDNIELESGEILETQFTIIATDAEKLLDNKQIRTTQLKSCFTFYFETEKRVIETALIGLLPEKESLINNIFYHTSLSTTSDGGKELLSVTVINDKNFGKTQLLAEVIAELKKYFNIEILRFIKMYEIFKALPRIENVQYNLKPSESEYASNIILAGDTMVNGSLNAAMLSGESAALALINSIQ